MRAPFFPFNRSWRLADAAQLATILEATACKAGNVHPGASFADMTYSDFLVTAATLQSALSQPIVERIGVGPLALQLVQAVRAAVGRNTNLGTILLLAPIVVAARQFEDHSSLNACQLKDRIGCVLASLSNLDSQLVYQAIREAQPGGLGTVAGHDVQSSAPNKLVDAMRLVADVDAVARQYCNGFADIFERLLPWLNEALSDSGEVFEAICILQLRWMAFQPDGLIVRKTGMEIATQAQQLALKCLTENGSLKPTDYQRLDEFLRADGHRRNPGTTADLIAATLFIRLITN